MKMPVAISDETKGAYRVAGSPTTFFITAAGRIADTQVGASPSELVYAGKLDALLAKKEDASQRFAQPAAPVPPLGASTPPASPSEAKAPASEQLTGFDLSFLAEKRRQALLAQFRAANCTCGCGQDLVTCVNTDLTCQTSRTIVSNLLKAEQTGKKRKAKR